MAMRYADLFAGAGGAHLGLFQAGLEPVAAVEHDAAACQVLTDAGWPTEPTDVREWTPVAADLWWASPPCQAFSTAGSRLGPGDERNGWPWLIDALDRADTMPTWLMCENVAGMTYHEETCSPTCPACYLAVVLGELRKRFRCVTHAVLNAANYGIPQRRRRLIIVAGPEVYRWPAQTHSGRGGVGLFGSTLPWVSMGDAIDLNGGRLIGAGTRPHGPGREHERTHRDITHEPAPCVTAAQIGNAGPWVEGEQRRRLTVRECAALQTFPPDWPWYGTKEQQYRQIGNACPPLLIQVLGTTLLRQVSP